MKIVVTRIQELEGKFGKSKKLTCSDGTIYNVKPKNEALYSLFNNPGEYDIVTGEYQGHPYIKDARALKPSPVAPSATPAIGNSQLANALDDKQLDIKIECFASIAQKSLEANGDKEITPKKIMNFVKDLLLMMDDIKDLYKTHTLGAIGKDYDEVAKEILEAKDIIEKPTAAEAEIW